MHSLPSMSVRRAALSCPRAAWARPLSARSHAGLQVRGAAAAAAASRASGVCAAAASSSQITADEESTAMTTKRLRRRAAISHSLLSIGMLSCDPVVLRRVAHKKGACARPFCF